MFNIIFLLGILFYRWSLCFYERYSSPSLIQGLLSYFPPYYSPLPAATIIDRRPRRKLPRRKMNGDVVNKQLNTNSWKLRSLSIAKWRHLRLFPSSGILFMPSTCKSPLPIPIYDLCLAPVLNSPGCCIFLVYILFSYVIFAFLQYIRFHRRALTFLFGKTIFIARLSLR